MKNRNFSEQLQNSCVNFITMITIGEYQVQFSPDGNIPNGIYTCRLTAGNNMESIQILIVR